jgi:tetratricopeptide (TPR) repeat protein
VLPKAQTEWKLGHLKQARALADGLRKCTGLTPRERFDLGLIYGRLHDFPMALAMFHSVDPSIPNLQSHAYAIALGQFELADYAGAIATLQALKAQVALNAASSNLLAVCESKTGSYQDAYALLVDQVRKNPGDALGYFNLITLLNDVGQLEQAVKVADRAVAAFPGDAEMLVVRGSAYSSVGQLDKARSDFAAAVDRSPKAADPRFFLAVTDYKLDRYDSAADELRAAITAGVVDADLEYLLAECLLKIDPGNVPGAMKELDRAIAIDDRAAQARTLRGKLLLESGDPRAALADLERAHRLDPSLRSATYNLARAYTALGRKADAAPLFQQIDRQSVDMVNELNERRMRQARSGNSPAE